MAVVPRSFQAIKNLQEEQADAAEAIDARYQKQIARQAARLAKHVEFLTEKGLLQEFNEWEDSHGRG